MRYLYMCILLLIITVGMVSCTPDPIEDQQSTTEIVATDDDKVTPPPSEETGEDDELEPNS